MNKIINSLWPGVVVGVSCFAAVGVRSHYSFLGLNKGTRRLTPVKLSTFSTTKIPPQFVVDLNGYGFGNDSLHWAWTDLKKESVFVNLKLSAATLRYYYPSLIWRGQRLHAICTDGTAPLKYPYDSKSHFKYWWTPFGAVNQLFDSTTEHKFIKSWSDEIDDHMYKNKNVCEIAWSENLGVSYTLKVGRDGDVMDSSMFLDNSHHKKTATKGGATGVVGDNKFPGNQLKIFFSGALSQIIANQVDTSEKFTDWLLGKSSCVKPDFPPREALKQALLSDGSWMQNWSEQPVWGAEKDEVSLLKKVIASGDHFTQIHSLAAKSASKDTGMVIKIVRRTIDVCDFVVEQQGSPHIYLTDDGYTFTKYSSRTFNDRSYSCTFGWKNSVPNLYLSDTSSIFYDRLTAYGGTGPGWLLGKKFRNGAFARDLDCIKEFIDGTIEKSLMDLNEYVSWSDFQELLQRALWYHQRINIKFGFFEDKKKPYRISVNWWDT